MNFCPGESETDRVFFNATQARDNSVLESGQSGFQLCRRIYKSQLVQTDPRGAPQHTKVDAQCNELAKVVGRTQLTTVDGRDEIFPNPEFGTKFQRIVPQISLQYSVA